MLPKYMLTVFIILFYSEVNGWEEIHNEEADESLEKVVQKWGYDGLESYNVTTTDGYIVNVIRIKREGADKLVPILFVHGLTGCAQSYFIGKNESPPIVFADNGYDVWLLNNRGTHLSSGHTKWNANTDKEFWTFSWQEIGLFDLPAAIDLVLQNNMHEKIILLGHSEGSTVIFVTLSELPEYNKKVFISIHWGVSVYHDKCSTVPMIQLICKMGPMLNNIMDTLGWFTVYPNKQIGQFMSNLCKFTVFKPFCIEVGKYFMFQKESKYLETVDWPYVFSKAFCGGSTKELFHYFQVGNSGRFARYDYGPTKNLKIYNSTEPPLFHLKNVNSAVVLWCGDDDVYCTKDDINKLTAQLPNVVSTNFTGKSVLSHVDFLLTDDIYKRIYNDLFRIIRKYST